LDAGLHLCNFTLGLRRTQQENDGKQQEEENRKKAEYGMGRKK
jgi:hypothetical protein